MGILTVTSGTRGLGTTTIATNLAVVVARRGQKVTLVDFSSGRDAAASRLGGSSMAVVGRGGRAGAQRPLAQDSGGPSLRIISVSDPGIRRAWDPKRAAALTALLDAETLHADLVIADLPVGHAQYDAVSRMSRRIIFLLAPVPSTSDPTRALLTRLGTVATASDLGILVNGVAGASEAEAAQRAFAIPDRGRSVELYGHIVADPLVRRAQMRQQAVVEYQPSAPASRGLERLGRRLTDDGPGGGGLSLLPPAWMPADRTVVAEVPQCA